MDLFNSKAILGEKRTQWIDYDKGISIILVGYGHTFAILQGHGLDFQNYPFFNYIGIFLYGFRMPLFFIISGMLISKSLEHKGLSIYIQNRASNILHPLIIWGVIEISIKTFTAGSLPSGKVLIADYLNLLIDPRKTGVFWYLNALFFIGAIYSILKVKMKLNTIHQLILGLVLFFISAYIHIYNRQGGFLTDIFEYYLFFAIGDFISSFMLSDRGKKFLTSASVFIPLLISFILLQYYSTEINMSSQSSGMSYVERKFPFLFLLQALIGCAISMSFSFYLQKSNKLIFIRVIGFHSLFIYCMQIIVMNILRMFLTGWLAIRIVPVIFILTWVLGIVLPIIIYNLSLRWKMWWLYTFKKPSRLSVLQSSIPRTLINQP